MTDLVAIDYYSLMIVVEYYFDQNLDCLQNLKTFNYSGRMHFERMADQQLVKDWQKNYWDLQTDWVFEYQNQVGCFDLYP